MGIIQSQAIQAAGQAFGAPIRGGVAEWLENTAEAQGIPAVKMQKRKKKSGYTEGYFPDNETRTEIMRDAYGVPDYKA